MAEKYQSLFDDSLLLAHWAGEYDAFKGSVEAGRLLDRLKNWAAKDFQKEVSTAGTFIDIFFKQTWGYVASGEGETAAGFTVFPEFPVPGSGQTGGTGEPNADLTLLAPDIIEAILDGKEPSGLSLARLTKKQIPLPWDEQRTFFGF